MSQFKTCVQTHKQRNNHSGNTTREYFGIFNNMKMKSSLKAREMYFTPTPVISKHNIAVKKQPFIG